MRQLSSRIVYQNAWMKVREDVVERLDGSTGIYGVVMKPDFAIVVPRGEGGFWMVDQFRYPIQRRSLEFPMGSWPGEPGGDQEALARTELAEETGLREGERALEATELDMEHRFVTDAELDELIASGAVVDSCTVAALALYHRAR